MRHYTGVKRLVVFALFSFILIGGSSLAIGQTKKPPCPPGVIASGCERWETVQGPTQKKELPSRSTPAPSKPPVTQQSSRNMEDLSSKMQPSQPIPNSAFGSSSAARKAALQRTGSGQSTLTKADPDAAKKNPAAAAAARQAYKPPVENQKNPLKDSADAFTRELENRKKK